MRDRERGIPRFNEFRRLTHLPPVESFEKLTPNREHSNLLKELYEGDIEKVDLLIGCLAEEPRPDGYGFGETAFNIFLLMASRRLKTDRSVRLFQFVHEVNALSAGHGRRRSSPNHC